MQITAAVSMDRLVLNCPYLANPSTAQVHWSKEAQDISIQDENEKYEIFPNGSLQISRITLSDSREYTCLVTNEIGTDEVTYTLLVIGEDIAVCLSVCLSACTCVIHSFSDQSKQMMVDVCLTGYIR